MSQTILRASAVEIEGWLKADPLDAKVFARILYLVRRVEEIACADGRFDEISIKTRALESLEGKAPITHAAIRDDLFSGNPSLRAKHISLEEASASLRQQVEGVRALSAGGEYTSPGSNIRRLGTGENRSGEGEQFTERGEPLNRRPPLKSYEEEMEDEHREGKMAPQKV